MSGKSKMKSLDEAKILERTPYTGHYEFCVWKCHKPAYKTVYNEDTGETSFVQTPQERFHILRLVNSYNLFETLDGLSEIRLEDQGYTITRGIRIRTIRQREDTLPEPWEKEWQLLYLLDGVYYWAEPHAKVYECDGDDNI